MADFIYDGTSLPYPKQDKIPLPPTEDGNKYVVALDWNTVCQAVVDARSAITEGQWWGLKAVASEPSPPPEDSVKLFVRKDPNDPSTIQLCVKFSTGEVVTIVETSQ